MSQKLRVGMKCKKVLFRHTVVSSGVHWFMSEEPDIDDVHVDFGPAITVGSPMPKKTRSGRAAIWTSSLPRTLFGTGCTAKVLADRPRQPGMSKKTCRPRQLSRHVRGFFVQPLDEACDTFQFSRPITFHLVCHGVLMAFRSKDISYPDFTLGKRCCGWTVLSPHSQGLDTDTEKRSTHAAGVSVRRKYHEHGFRTFLPKSSVFIITIYNHRFFMSVFTLIHIWPFVPACLVGLLLFPFLPSLYPCSPFSVLM